MIIFISVLFTLGVFFSLINSKKDVNNISIKPEQLSNFDTNSIENEIPPKGDFINISLIPDSIGNLYVVGIYKNIGKSPMRKPEVSVILYSKDGRKVASSHGYGLRDFLLPTEDTPLSILFRDVPQYFRYEVKHEPKRPYSHSKLNRAKIIFKNTTLKRGKYSGYVVIGDLYNNDEKSIKYASFTALVYDAKGKIIGQGTGYLKEKNLGSEDYSPFKINITKVIGKPASFKIDYNATLNE